MAEASYFTTNTSLLKVVTADSLFSNSNASSYMSVFSQRLIVFCFKPRSRIFHSYDDVNMTNERLQKFAVRQDVSIINAIPQIKDLLTPIKTQMVCCLSSRSSTLHLYPRDENYAPEGPQNVSLNLISISYSFQVPSIPYSKTIKGICRLLSISIRFR